MVKWEGQTKGKELPMFNIVLVEPEIPENTGNISRTCAVTGAALHLVRPLGFSTDDKHLKRAGLDYWKYLSVTYYDSFEETLRHAAFQVSSIMTTTGFVTTDFDTWPEFSKTVLLCLMVIGACAGSTGGGFKCSRVVLMLKELRRSVQRIIHPGKVQVIRFNGRAVEEKVMDNTKAFMAAYAIILAVSVFLISVDGFSITTNLSAVLACFNNIGPGLDVVGPSSNFETYSMFSKIILIIDMLAGRLEIFPILILFSRSTWRNR